MGNTEAALRKDARERSAGLHLRVWLSTLVALALALFVWWQASRWYEARLLAEQRAHVEGQMIPYGNALSGAVTRRVALLDALAAFVRAEPPANLRTHFPVFGS